MKGNRKIQVKQNRIVRFMLGHVIKNKGGKFLKNLWCCIGGEYYKVIWFYQLGL